MSEAKLPGFRALGLVLTDRFLRHLEYIYLKLTPKVLVHVYVA